MEQQIETTSRTPRATELIRPVEGRVIAGVSEGIANRLEIPSWIVRAAFIVIALLGGLGLALYGAGWLLIRSEDEPESIANRLTSDLTSLRSWIGIGLIVLAAMLVLDTFTFFDGGVLFAVGLLVIGVLLYTGQISAGGPKGGSGPASASAPTDALTMPSTPVEDSGNDQGPPPAEPAIEQAPPPPPVPRERSILGRLTFGAALVAAGLLAVLDNISAIPIDAAPRHHLALAVTILGLGLLVGAFMGRARWLILVGAILLPILVMSPVFEYDWNSEQFEVMISPETFHDLEGDYAVEVGNLVIDLTELPWDGETIDLVAHADAGNIEIFIPEDVGVVGSASVDIGRVGSPGRVSAGLGDPNLDFDEVGMLGTVNLHASVDIGNIDIHRRP